MKSIVSGLTLLMILGLYSAAMLVPWKNKPPVKNEVVKIYSKLGSCTGVEVRGFLTGNIYTLTAGHCDALFIGDDHDQNVPVYAQTQDGEVIRIYEILEDPKSDLMLLTSAGNDSMPVAKKVIYGEHIYTLTHGAGFPAYRTDGELLQKAQVVVGLFPLNSDLADKWCSSMSKYVKTADILGLPVCALDVQENYATAWIVPGSSGGPMIDDDNHLIGIATATGGQFSAWVTLEDIQRFLADK